MGAEENIFGLIGYPLAHSFSKKYFTDKFEREEIENTEYQLFPLNEISELPSLLGKHSNLRGLNVTIPYKEAVIPLLDEVDASAEFGAVNTIKIENGKLVGYNTDVFGFEQAIAPFSAHISKALVLGTGGASKAVCHVLKQKQITYQLVSRTTGTNKITYNQLTADNINDYHLIVNTTPLGTFPNENTFPDIPYQHLNGQHVLVDLVYNPAVTTFLQKAAEQGCTIKNGLEMLQLQAEKAWEIWNKQ